MADAAQIAELRGLINEPTQSPYNDDNLSMRLDAGTSVRSVASAIWSEKAASYAGLVDIKEGSSDRKLSQLYSQALAMSKAFDSDEDPTAPENRRVSRTRRIERQ